MITDYEILRDAARRICEDLDDDKAFTFTFRHSKVIINIYGGYDERCFDDVDEAIAFTDGVETTIENFILRKNDRQPPICRKKS